MLEQTLARNGVIKDYPIDKKYDAIRHEAMQTLEVADKAPGTVAFVL